MSTQRHVTQDNAQDQDRGSTPRLMTYLALFLAVVFIGAVLFGAKMIADRETYSPVVMGPIDAPDARSAVCTNVLDAKPDNLASFRSVDVVEPVPRGAMAFRNSDGTELTVRCGIPLPDQYTVLSPVSVHDGLGWFDVKDATEGSNLSSWYSVTASPAFAVTSEADRDDVVEAIDELSELIAAEVDDSETPEPNSAPLVGEPMAKDKDAAVCSKFAAELPEEVDGYHLQTTDEVLATAENTGDGLPAASKETMKKIDALKKALDDDLMVYLSETQGYEPIVVRCGVDFPESYEVGERLTQVNDVPWFDAPALAEGSTIGTWYAIGHDQIVAVAMPQATGDNVIPAVTEAIEATMEKH